jgi:CubicO group peptidase (beta-lactamase class C family)
MSYKSSSICLKCSLLAGFLLLLQPVIAQYSWDELDQQLQAKQKSLGNNLVMMLWKGDTLAYKKELGDFNSKTQAPIANASKWLTAALVMIFVDEGKIGLDDKVTKWLPEFERYNKNYITIRLCLAHMTGIEDEGNLLKKIFQRKKFASLEEEVNALAARQIRTNPGQDFWYGSIGPNIAGRVLEVVSKKRFDVLIKQKLFNPLEMRRTTFTTQDASAVNPSAGAVSTADDYMQFLVMLLNKGKYKGKQVISEEGINTLMQVQTRGPLITYAPPAVQGFNYALGGWAIQEKDGKATALASPGFSGTWPIVDFCRGYASLVLVKKPLDHETAGMYPDLTKIIDAQIVSACP